MQSISEAAAHLQVGKSRLYALLKDHRIEPRKNGRRKELSDDQVEQLVQIIAAGEPPPERESEAGTAPSSSGGQLAEDPTAMLLVEELRGQNQVLLEQLRHEQDERKAERQERENYQQMLAALQQNNQRLLQENHRMQLELLEAPKPSRFEMEDAEAEVEESVEVNPSSEPVVAAEPVNYAPAKSSWGLGLGLGAVAAAIIFYVLTSDQGAKFFPNIQQKLVGALHLAETPSIVPYQFDAGGGVR